MVVSFWATTTDQIIITLATRAMATKKGIHPLLRFLFAFVSLAPPSCRFPPQNLQFAGVHRKREFDDSI